MSTLLACIKLSVRSMFLEPPASFRIDCDCCSSISINEGADGGDAYSGNRDLVHNRRNTATEGSSQKIANQICKLFSGNE